MKIKYKTFFFAAVMLLVSVALCAQNFEVSSPVVTNLSVDGKTSPDNHVSNVSTYTPMFSWTFTDDDTGDGQTAFTIHVGTDVGFADMWSVEHVSGTDTRMYGGSALLPNTTYFWEVRVRDRANLWSSFAQGSFAVLDMGLRIYDGTSVVKRIAADDDYDAHKLRIRGNGATYGIPLVAPTAYGASSTHIQTSVGVEALRLMVPPLPAVDVSPGYLNFTGVAGGSDPAPQTVSVTNAGGGTLDDLSTNITYQSGSAWLTADLDGITAPADLTVTLYLAGLTAGTYEATVEVSSGVATNSPQNVFVSFTVTPVVWYVTPAGAGSQTGGDWTNAFGSIQEAVDAASSGEEIWVGAGTYSLPTGTEEDPSEILVDRIVGIYGGFTGTETSRVQRDWRNNTTTVRGTGYETRCFHLTANATIDGFTVTGGRISTDVSVPEGAGILVESDGAAIRNCIVTDNRASITGGGIALSGAGNSSLIYNTVISENFSMYSVGGIIASGSPRLVNCVIANNYGENVGGIRCSNAVMTNCTIYGNGCEPSSSSASGVDCAGTLTITNSIVWGNQDNDGYMKQIDSGAGSSSVSYCDIDQDGFAGANGNIRSDPLFVDSGNGDFRLQPSSPCIDTGNNSAPEIAEVDIEGDPRIADGDGDDISVVDMGAGEYSGI